MLQTEAAGTRHMDKPSSDNANSADGLDTRTGLPDDLRVLAEQYPRRTWPGHGNLGGASQFWLQRHDMFRQLLPALIDGSRQFQENRVETDKYHGWFVQSFNFLIEQLHSHHQVEDLHYFPVLIKADTRLLRGFELLDRDHKAIHVGLMSMLNEAKALDEALRVDPIKTALANGAMTRSFEGFRKSLDRHLEDEEDLVIPLILDRGEAELGLA
jgi:iron-sulfur cluster repair protein YtfE (RIC family)